jgi:ABC-2 type transport system permease protein
VRYFRLFRLQVRISLIFALQYRSDFAVDGAVEIMWALAAVLPLVVVLQGGRTIGGFSYAESLVVVGFFTLLKAIVDGAVGPSIATVVEHVRKGTLDFVLLKPADAQFLVSTARFYPWRAINVMTSFAIFIYAFHLLGRWPSFFGVLESIVLLVNAIVILHALLVLTVSIAFYAVRVDNLTFLLGSVFDAARWPGTVFHGFLRVLFTFVIPLIVMTTYPAQALLGTLPITTLFLSTALAALFAIVARLVWRRAVASYTSASS